MFEQRRKKIKDKILMSDEKVLAEFGPADTYTDFWLFLGLVISVISSIFISWLWIGLFLGVSLIAFSFYLKASYLYFFTKSADCFLLSIFTFLFN